MTAVDSHTELDTLIATAEKDLRRQGLAALTPQRPVPDWLLVLAIAALVTGLVMSFVGWFATGWVVLVGAALSAAGGFIVTVEAHRTGHLHLGAQLIGALVPAPLFLLVAHFVKGDDWDTAFMAAGLGALCGVLWMLALHSMVRLALTTLSVSVFRSLLGALPATFAAAGRATPVAFAVLLVGFFTDDAWTVVDALSWPRYAGLLLVMLTIAALAAGSAAWKERALLANRRASLPYCEQLEMACLERGLAPASLGQLRRAQKANVALAYASTILARLVLVWVLVSAMFVVIGVVAVDDDVAAAIREEQSAHGGLTWTLLGLASLLGAVASLTFAAGALADSAQRRDLVGDQAARLGGRLAVWRLYWPLVTIGERKHAASDEPVG